MTIYFVDRFDKAVGMIATREYSIICRGPVLLSLSVCRRSSLPDWRVGRVEPNHTTARKPGTLCIIHCSPAATGQWNLVNFTLECTNHHSNYNFLILRFCGGQKIQEASREKSSTCTVRNLQNCLIIINQFNCNQPRIHILRTSIWRAIYCANNFLPKWHKMELKQVQQ